MKAWYQSKTVAANGLIVGLAYWFRASDFYVDPMRFVVAIALTNIALRAATRVPLYWRARRVR